MKQTVKTSRAAGQLEKMFRALNTRFFDGKLPEHHLRQNVDSGHRAAPRDKHLNGHA